MELIKVENGVSLLDIETSHKIAEIEDKMKVLKNAQDDLKKAILEEMQAKNIIKIDNDDLTITFVAETYRETFDSKKLKADDEETYNKYINISPVKASIRIKTKHE